MKMRIFWTWLSLCLGISTGLQARDTKATRTALFAGGCFWCMQQAYDGFKGKGVVKTTVGYTGGKVKNPSYEQVSSGRTGHVEAIQVVYDPNMISYEKLLDIYWHNVDPTDQNGQFCDKGKQYRSIIFYENSSQKRLAEASKENLLKTQEVSAVYTEILPAQTFYPAEEYHQEYYKKNPFRYKFYKMTCGRDKRLKEIWQKK